MPNLHPRLQALVETLLAAPLNPRFRSGALEMLFVCGHMRSGSSLLVHILNSNPEIIGYGETHRTYATSTDFGKCAADVYLSFASLPSGERYIMDKILHPGYIERLELLSRGKTIFILRRPVPALLSILGLNLDVSKSPRTVFRYYVNRLEWVRDTARSLDVDEYTFVTYEELTQNTDHAFEKIGNVLHLSTSLTGNYETMWSTGKGEIGDFSDVIHSGEIETPKKWETTDEIAPFVEEARNLFEQCLHELETNAS